MSYQRFRYYEKKAKNLSREKLEELYVKQVEDIRNLEDHLAIANGRLEDNKLERVEYKK